MSFYLNKQFYPQAFSAPNAAEQNERSKTPTTVHTSVTRVVSRDAQLLDRKPELAPYDPSLMYDQDTFHLPTPGQLHDTSIILDFDRDRVVAVRPIEKLRSPVERYLPPSGKYYDQFTITLMKPFLAGRAQRCCSCWFGLRHGNTTKCKYACLVCRTGTHHGAECPLIFASGKWWREQGHTPKASVQQRPTPSELVYLITAGFVLYRPGMAYREPLVVNMKHPLVRSFYNGRKPDVSLPDWMEDFTEKTLAAQPKPLPSPAKPEGVTLVGQKQIHDVATREDKRGGDISQEAMDELFATETVRLRKEIYMDDKEHRERTKKVQERLKRGKGQIEAAKAREVAAESREHVAKARQSVKALQEALRSAQEVLKLAEEDSLEKEQKARELASQFLQDIKRRER